MPRKKAVDTTNENVESTQVPATDIADEKNATSDADEAVETTEPGVEAETNENEESEPADTKSAEVLEEDEMELFNKFLADEKTYGKRRVEGATRDVRQELYGDAENVVRVEGSKAETEGDKLRREVEDLKSAATAVPPHELTGIVDSFHKGNTGWVIELQLKDSPGKIPILVPLEHFHVVEGKEYENNVVVINDLTGRVGAEVKFIPYLVKEATKKGEKTFAIASCVYAMEQEGYKNFIREMSDEKPKYVSGQILPAVVVGVRRDKIKVNVMGVEATIDSSELSWTALDSIEKEFKVGDEFYVKVSNVRQEEYTVGNKTYNLVRLQASKRQAEQNPAKKYINDFREGEMCRGVVKAFTNTGLVFVRVKDKMDCLCHASASGTNMRGDHVVVRIKTVDKDNYQLYGTIHRG